jgi:hypothetical protein
VRRSNGAVRFKVLVLIASLAAFLLWLLGPIGGGNRGQTTI